MKTVSIILMFLLISTSVYSQYGDLIFSDTIDFETSHNWVILDTVNNDNIWEIGVPTKSYFDSSFTVPNAIVTDLTNSYPVNNSSHFDIVIDDGNPGWWEWGEGIISFWHKYDTDMLYDGGYITISNDGGLSWVNIINDNSNISILASNFYSDTDTISGGIPAFTGFSNGWVYSKFYWHWLALTKELPQDSLILRFNFQSDNNNSNKDGWMIDHFQFLGYEVSGSVEGDYIKREVIVYPIPANDYFIIHFENNCEFVFELYDCVGKQVIRKENIKANSFRVGDVSLLTGIYSYRLFSNELIYSGKILMN